MAEKKVLGPDGFPSLFFKKYWPIIQTEVKEAVREFFSTGEMPTAWMRTSITLIPKKPDATELCHYRPISVCTILYKIYAKLMVERLKPVLPCLIYPK